MSDWTPIGEIVMLQIQLDNLTDDEKFSTEKLVQVDRLRMTPDGAIGFLNGAWVLDRHHRQHPACSSHWNGDRALSVGFTSHYDHMWNLFRKTDLGSAGENLVVAADEMVAADQIAGGVRIESARGAVDTERAMIAQPCVQFTRYLTERPDLDAEAIAPYRDELRRGVRGYVMPLTGILGAELVVGDKLSIRPNPTP